MREEALSPRAHSASLLRTWFGLGAGTGDKADDKAKNEIFGSGGRDRTYDQLINSQLLYR
jgi:hypothetical protein